MQLDLFSEIVHAYAAERSGILDNPTLYEHLAKCSGQSLDEWHQRQPVGKTGALHNLATRRVRWWQQSLKASGILENVEGERGFWRLTKPVKKDLNEVQPNVSVLGFSTDLGLAILGSCETVFQSFDAPISLVLTSLPYALAKSRAYGNVTEFHYVDWVCKTLEPVIKHLAPHGSILLNISNDIFEKGSPARSLYRERLVIALHDRLGLKKMDEFIWTSNKPPGPIQWASLERFHLNTGYEPVYWFAPNPHLVKADNRRVLQAHSEKHLKLIHQGGENREGVYSDGAYRIYKGSYGNETPGKIPRNVLYFPNTCASQREYKRNARAAGLRPHGAPMPLSMAKFFVEYLTEKEQLVVDPFGGSQTTPLAAELLGRRWLSTEIMAEYVLGGATRFTGMAGFHQQICA